MSPSSTARHRLPHLHSLLGSLDALLAEARPATGHEVEPLRMGVSPLIHPALVARAFQAAGQGAPAALFLREDNLAGLYTALLGRQLDLILVPAVTDAEGCNRQPVDREAICYLPGSATSRQDTREPIEVSVIDGDPVQPAAGPPGHRPVAGDRDKRPRAAGVLPQHCAVLPPSAGRILARGWDAYPLPAARPPRSSRSWRQPAASGTATCMSPSPPPCLSSSANTSGRRESAPNAPTAVSATSAFPCSAATGSSSTASTWTSSGSRPSTCPTC